MVFFFRIVFYRAPSTGIQYITEGPIFYQPGEEDLSYKILNDAQCLNETLNICASCDPVLGCFKFEAPSTLCTILSSPRLWSGELIWIKTNGQKYRYWGTIPGLDSLLQNGCSTTSFTIIPPAILRLRSTCTYLEMSKYGYITTVKTLYSLGHAKIR